MSKTIDFLILGDNFVHQRQIDTVFTSYSESSVNAFCWPFAIWQHFIREICIALNHCLFKHTFCCSFSTSYCKSCSIFCLFCFVLCFRFLFFFIYFIHTFTRSLALTLVWHAYQIKTLYKTNEVDDAKTINMRSRRWKNNLQIQAKREILCVENRSMCQ